MVNADSINIFILNNITTEEARTKASAQIQEALDRLVAQVSDREGEGQVTNLCASEISSSADYGYGDSVSEWLTKEGKGDPDLLVLPAQEAVSLFEDRMKDTMYLTAGFLRTLNDAPRLHTEEAE